MTQEAEAGVRVPERGTKVTVTLQSLVMGPVLYVLAEYELLPERVPVLHPVFVVPTMEDMEYPGLGVMTKSAVPPLATVLENGEMVPPTVPAIPAVTVYVVTGAGPQVAVVSFQFGLSVGQETVTAVELQLSLSPVVPSSITPPPPAEDLSAQAWTYTMRGGPLKVINLETKRVALAPRTAMFGVTG